METGMINLTVHEEKLYREAISYLCQSGATDDLHERNELLKEAARRISHIKRETQKRKERELWKS